MEHARFHQEEEKNCCKADAREVIGKSAALKRVMELVEKVAGTDSTVLILGETGTGKELVATGIHHVSSRRNYPFVRANCSSIPAGLLESELFGHEKGAFTGVVSRQLGRIQLADRGTLFLDEVGDIPHELKSKSLRVLQEQEIERFGSSCTIRVDFRLIAATNRDMIQLVKLGQFRLDLFYRHNVFPINVPPLRERREDIPLLGWHFVKKHAHQMKKQIDTVTDNDMETSVHYDWPGNIRELQNIIERSVILSSDTVLHLCPMNEMKHTEKNISPAARTLDGAERAHILQALRDTDGVLGGGLMVLLFDSA